MAKQYVNDVNGKYKVAMKDDNDKTIAFLIWGDPVKVTGNASQGWLPVKARGREGWIPAAVVGNDGLLEIYVIDVGQGDGVLMRTPQDDAWHLIDAGVSNERQMTKKGAANFLRWKFIKELGRNKVSLDSVIVTHPDFDHYGGLLDLLAGKLYDGREFDIEVNNFYHSGMGRFAQAPKLGKTAKGKVAPLPYDDYNVGEAGTFIVELLDGKATFKDNLDRFEKTFAGLARLVAQVPSHVNRLSDHDEWLPGYKSGDGDVSIRILGPIVEEVIGKGPGMRLLGDESKTRNGHSIVLRVQYGDARILLTGDLNTASQKLLLSYHLPREFTVDVAKGCHHGSDDIDLRFVKAMAARSTVISSGDNEDYAHPRPRVLGASAKYGREAKDDRGKILPPLLYSTELARSVRLEFAAAVKERSTGDEIDAADAEVKAQGKQAKYEGFDQRPIATDLIYGLINVRTDGKHIMCAYMKEASEDFDIKVFRAGIDPM